MTKQPQQPGDPQATPEERGNRRDPEDRPTHHTKEEVREKNMDKTLADSFPTSDPPSSIPDPEGEEEAA